MNDSFWLQAYLGSLKADALAMPVHWYYDREALREDYGEIDRYLAPKHPHRGSILWRSSYEALNEKGEILHDQAEFWGQRDIHYHQNLAPGENTLNYQLAQELVRFSGARGGYDSDAWLDRYIEVMLTPGWHRDTYFEEYHRGFFTLYASGKAPRKCSIRDEHIGGLAQVPALCHALISGSQIDDLSRLRAQVKEHVGLTHAHPRVLLAADTLVRLLWRIGEEGESLDDSMRQEAGDWLSCNQATKWIGTLDDEAVVGAKFSTACYIDHAMPASLYLALKYAGDLATGIQANAQVGGDNCHRGAVVGALLGGPMRPEDFERVLPLTFEPPL